MQDDSTEMVIGLPLSALFATSSHVAFMFNYGSFVGTPEVLSAAALGHSDHFPCSRKGVHGGQPRVQLVVPNK